MLLLWALLPRASFVHIKGGELFKLNFLHVIHEFLHVIHRKHQKKVDQPFLPKRTLYLQLLNLSTDTWLM